MTALATKPRHEPEESEDPRNALLDAAEELIRSCIAHGLAPQIEARLARLLPKPPPAAPSGDVWEASVVLTALAEARRKIKSPASAKLIDTAHGFAKARFETLKASKDPVA